MSPKDLKQLAKACRKAGILHFKNSEVEFTLAEEHITNYKPTTKKTPSSKVDTADSIDNDGQLSEEALLLWSTGEVSA